MAEETFTCRDCGKSFNVKPEVLARYPGWTPAQCWPCKNAKKAASGGNKTAPKKKPLQETQERQQEGRKPDHPASPREIYRRASRRNLHRRRLHRQPGAWRLGNRLGEGQRSRRTAPRPRSSDHQQSDGAASAHRRLRNASRRHRSHHLERQQPLCPDHQPVGRRLEALGLETQEGVPS